MTARARRASAIHSAPALLRPWPTIAQPLSDSSAASAVGFLSGLPVALIAMSGAALPMSGDRFPPGEAQPQLPLPQTAAPESQVWLSHGVPSCAVEPTQAP